MLIDFMTDDSNINPAEPIFDLPQQETKKKMRDKEEEPTSGNAFTVKILKDVVYYVLIIMFIGVGTMFIATVTLFVQSFNSKQASYENLSNQVTSQNAKIDTLTQSLQNSNSLESKIDVLTTKVNSIIYYTKPQ